MTALTYERGGIAYTLAVVEHEGCLYVRWKCPVCNAERETLRGCYDPDEALGRAQARVFCEHHIPVHVLGNASFSRGT